MSLASFPPDLQQKAASETESAASRVYRFIINDTFRCSLCLVHPPHLIALASIYLAFALHPPAAAAGQILAPDTPANAAPSANVSSRTRRRSVDMTATNSGAATATADMNGTAAPPQRPDPIAFLASLQVDQSIVLEIVQEIISLYDLWSQLESASNGSNGGGVSSPVAQQLGVGASARLASASGSNNLGGGSTGTNAGTGKGTPDDKVISIIRRMQEARMRELREERSKQAAARKVG